MTPKRALLKKVYYSLLKQSKMRAQVGQPGSKQH